MREKTTAPALETVKRGEVVGRTHKVVLDDPRKTEPKPVASTDLEPTGFIGQDEPIEPDEVKEEYRPSDEELYDQDASPDEDGDFSSGVTIEELSEATDVIQNGPKDELALLKAAKTVYDAQDTEIFDHFANMASKKIALDELLRQGLDEHGVPRWRKSRRYLEFDMDMMV